MIEAPFIDALARIGQDVDDVSILIVGIDQCDSCRSLKEDAAEIFADLDVSNVFFAYLNLADNDELAAMQRMRLTDVPATYALAGEKIVGGWFGYDLDKPRDFRIGALKHAVQSKIISFQGSC